MLFAIRGHPLSGHGLGWIPGVGDGQGGLACCGSWGRKESDMTEQLNSTELTHLPRLPSVSCYFLCWACPFHCPPPGKLLPTHQIPTQVGFPSAASSLLSSPVSSTLLSQHLIDFSTLIHISWAAPGERTLLRYRDKGLLLSAFLELIEFVKHLLWGRCHAGTSPKCVIKSSPPQEERIAIPICRQGSS